MPITVPGTTWDPLGSQQTEPRLTHHDIVCLHTMAGYFESVDSSFHENGYGGLESHFGMRADGFTKQWQDLEFQADANFDGNYRCISIETEDHGPEFTVGWTNGSDVPAWTNQQVDKIVEIVRWLCDTFDIPKELVPDSKPGRRGIAYHRQGIDPWRVSGGELWSEANGKVCPGDRRIHQLTTIIIPRVQGTDSFFTSEVEMQLIRRRSDGHVVMLAGGKLMKVTGPDNWAEAEKGNTPRIILDDDEYNRVINNLGPVLD